MSLSSSECAICHKPINMYAEDWMEIDVQIKNVTVKVTLCEDHASRMRMKAAGWIGFTV